MKTRVYDATESFALPFVNGTGAAIAAGAFLLFGGLIACAQCDIAAAAGSTGTVQIGGVFEVTKQSADAMTQGQTVGYDFDNQRADSTFGGNLVVVEAAGSGVLTVKVRLSTSNLMVVKHTASAGEGTADAIVIDFGVNATPTGPVEIQIESTTGVRRAPQGVNSWGTSTNLGKLTVNDSGLLVNEILHVFAWF